MIKEYVVCIISHLSDGTARLNRFKRQSINLRYVSAAWSFDEGHSAVTVNGQADFIIIDEAYDRFMRDWHSVKR